jgi:hypothetical protein
MTAAVCTIPSSLDRLVRDCTDADKWEDDKTRDAVWNEARAVASDNVDGTLRCLCRHGEEAALELAEQMLAKGSIPKQTLVQAIKEAVDSGRWDTAKSVVLRAARAALDVVGEVGKDGSYYPYTILDGGFQMLGDALAELVTEDTDLCYVVFGVANNHPDGKLLLKEAGMTDDDVTFATKFGYHAWSVAQFNGGNGLYFAAK